MLLFIAVQWNLKERSLKKEGKEEKVEKKKGDRRKEKGGVNSITKSDSKKLIIFLFSFIAFVKKN